MITGFDDTFGKIADVAVGGWSAARLESRIRF
jgi:hypothetical protein